MIGDSMGATTHAALKPEVIARIIVKTRNVSVTRAVRDEHCKRTCYNVCTNAVCMSYFNPVTILRDGEYCIGRI